MLMVPKATPKATEFRRLLRDDLMLMVPKATERQFDVNGSEGY